MITLHRTTSSRFDMSHLILLSYIVEGGQGRRELGGGNLVVSLGV